MVYRPLPGRGAAAATSPDGRRPHSATVARRDGPRAGGEAWTAMAMAVPLGVEGMIEGMSKPRPASARRAAPPPHVMRPASAGSDTGWSGRTSGPLIKRCFMA